MSVNVHFSALGARTVVECLSGCSAPQQSGSGCSSTRPTHNVPRNLGLTLLVVALLGPILWNWYATWGVIVLAPAATPTLRRVVIAISTFEAFVGISSVKNLVLTTVHAGTPARPHPSGRTLRRHHHPVGPVRPESSPSSAPDTHSDDRTTA